MKDQVLEKKRQQFEILKVEMGGRHETASDAGEWDVYWALWMDVAAASLRTRPGSRRHSAQLEDLARTVSITRALSRRLTDGSSAPDIRPTIAAAVERHVARRRRRGR